MIYRYRELITEHLPARIRNRDNCWHGKDCRTQANNPAHAQKLNQQAHVQLSRIEDDLYKQLPNDLKDLIRMWRDKERKEKANAQLQGSQQANNKQHTNANLVEMEQQLEDLKFSPEELATIDEFLEAEEDSDEDNCS